MVSFRPSPCLACSFLLNPNPSSLKCDCPRCQPPHCPIGRQSRYAQRMVRFTVLASGSKGNSTVVTGGRTRILVDAGLSCRELFRRMKLAGEDPATLDAIVITHEHSDHVGGLAVTARKLGIPVYFTEGTHRAWMRWLTPRRQMTYAQWLEQCRKQAAERQAEAESAQEDGEPDDAEEVGAMVTPRVRALRPPLQPVRRPALPLQTARPPANRTPPGFRVSSIFRPASLSKSATLPSAPSPSPTTPPTPSAFVFRAEGVRMAFATDLGYIPPNVKAQLQRGRPAAARIQPRSGNAARRSLPLGSETKGTFARGSPLQRGGGRVPGE
jgi:phosphoribosyl 1,2-cyclic phosphodiesterase